MKRIAVVFGCMSVAVVALRVLLVPSAPDALESVAGTLGFAGLAVEGEDWIPLADYQARFFASVWFARLSAGLAGVFLVCGLGVLLGRLIPRKRGDG